MAARASNKKLLLLLVLVGLASIRINNEMTTPFMLHKSNSLPDHADAEKEPLSSFRHVKALPLRDHAGDGIRISFQLHNRSAHPLTNRYNPYVTCPLGMQHQGKGNRRKSTGETRDETLPPLLDEALDFTVTIQTDLKILHVGDSVMVQLAQAFDEMAACTFHYNNSTACHRRKVLWEAWKGHDGRTAIPAVGGGVSSLWRMTALLSRSREGGKPANNHGGGWSMSEVDAFLSCDLSDYINREVYSDRTHHHNLTLQNFDVVVFRVMHGWMPARDITNNRLLEAIQLSNELLGATTVVLMTVPFTNNVVTVEEMKKVRNINENIRSIAGDWHRLKNNSGVENVLVLEYGAYYNHLIWANALHIGYNVSSPLDSDYDVAVNEETVFSVEGPTFLYKRLQTGKEWPPSISMVCSNLQSLKKYNGTKCERNFLFSDGQHICPKTLASRYGAGLACLLGCVYNDKSTDIGGRSYDLRECERECNKQFMSVIPVEEVWMGADVELVTFGWDTFNISPLDGILMS